MSGSEPTAAQRNEIANTLVKIRDSMQTPELVGRSLVDFLLTEAATKGTFTLTGAIEVQVTATINLPGSKGLITSAVCGSMCFSAFGHNIICCQVCHTEK